MSDSENIGFGSLMDFIPNDALMSLEGGIIGWRKYVIEQSIKKIQTSSDVEYILKICKAANEVMDKSEYSKLEEKAKKRIMELKGQKSSNFEQVIDGNTSNGMEPAE